MKDNLLDVRGQRREKKRTEEKSVRAAKVSWRVIVCAFPNGKVNSVQEICAFKVVARYATRGNVEKSKQNGRWRPVDLIETICTSEAHTLGTSRPLDTRQR